MPSELLLLLQQLLPLPLSQSLVILAVLRECILQLISDDECVLQLRECIFLGCALLVLVLMMLVLLLMLLLLMLLLLLLLVLLLLVLVLLLMLLCPLDQLTLSRLSMRFLGLNMLVFLSAFARSKRNRSVYGHRCFGFARLKDWLNLAIRLAIGWLTSFGPPLFFLNCPAFDGKIGI